MIKVENVNEVLSHLNKTPQELRSITKKAMRKAGTEYARTLKSVIPTKSGKKAVKVFFTKRGLLVVGLKGTRRTNPAEFFAFQKAYWLNYGTLSNRDAGHKFLKARKKESAQWQGGIKPRNFFDQVRTTAESELGQKIIQEIKKQL